MSELLRCPWCPRSRIELRWSGGVMLAQCQQCGVSKSGRGISLNDDEEMTEDDRVAALKQSAADEWNRRTPPIVGEDARDAVRFRWCQDNPKQAQAMFWNYSSRRERAKAIDAALAADSSREKP